MKKVLLSCVMMCALVVVMISTSIAGTDTDDNTGISVDIATDKENYNSGDEIGLNVTITNNSTYMYRNLYYEIDVPKELILPDKADTSGTFQLGANGTKNIKFNYSGQPAATVPKDDDKTSSDSDSGSVRFVVIIVIVAVIAIAVLALVILLILLILKKKSAKNTTALILIPALIISGLYSTNVQAAVPSLDDFSMTATKVITVDKKECNVTVKITANPDAEKEASDLVVSNIGIHDPSVFYDPVSGNYYSYGSHIIAGKSSDLVSWVYTANSSVGYASSNQLFSKHYLQEFADIYAWLGADVKEGIWALDVTYSEAAAKAGNDPYFMYVTVTNATRDALCLATSASPEGPFSFKEVLVYSDFRADEVKSGQVNLLDVLGVKSYDDLTTAQKNYYITGSTAAYRDKFPQCIDAAPYYDDKGNMYLAYGSFSSVGALHVLKLDPLTGLRAKDNYTYNPAELEDPYYGRQIATKRGEGPYVLRVPSEKSSTGNYYFLFWSQGTLAAQGGYNMRVLRSEYPDRGFVDYSGKSAMDSSVVGLRLMDNFWFTTMQYSSTANGGNSAIVTNDGKIFLHYHSKSAHAAAYGGTGEGFIIKSNQMFLNEDGWLTATPFKYYGETMNTLSKADVVGDYEFIYHTLNGRRRPANFNDNFALSEFVTLNDDGTVSGDYTGTWEMKDNYFNIKIKDKTYKGVVLEQYDESSQRVKTVVFTATGTDNRSVWGSKIYYTDEQRIKVDAANISAPSTATEYFTLETLGRLYSDISWTSDNDAILINGGKATVVPQDTAQTVKLTATISHGGKDTTVDFSVNVPAEEIFVPSTVSTSPINLPEKTAAGKKITWTSSDNNVINPTTGTVKVPASSSIKVTLTGKIDGSDKVITKEVTVMPLPTKEKYSEDFNNLGSLVSTEGGLWYSANAGGNLSLKPDSDGGKYVEFAPGNANSRGAVSTLPSKGQANGIYLLDFDLCLTAGDNQTTEFAVTTQNLAYIDNNMNNGIASGYLFKLSSDNSTTWTINGEDTVEIERGNWIHVNVLADTESQTATVTITDGDKTLYSGTVEMNGASSLKGFYIRGGRYNSVTGIDNVTVKAN